jgi:hypothetical protein
MSVFVPPGVTAQERSVALDIPLDSLVEFLALRHGVTATALTPLSDDEVLIVANEFERVVAIRTQR